MAETFEPWPAALKWVLLKLSTNQIPNKPIFPKEQVLDHPEEMLSARIYEATVLLSDEEMRLVMNTPMVLRANVPWKDGEHIIEFAHSGGLQTPYVIQAIADDAGIEKYNVRVALRTTHPPSSADEPSIGPQRLRSSQKQ